MFVPVVRDHVNSRKRAEGLADVRYSSEQLIEFYDRIAKIDDIIMPFGHRVQSNAGCSLLLRFEQG